MANWASASAKNQLQGPFHAYIYPYIQCISFMYPYIPLYTHMYPYISIWTQIYPNIPIYTHIYIHIYPYIPIFTPICTPYVPHIYPYILLYTPIYPYVPIYIHMDPYIPIYTHIQGVPKKRVISEMRHLGAFKRVLYRSILSGTLIQDTRLCLGTTGNVCVSLQCTLHHSQALQ